MERTELPIDILDKCVQFLPSWERATLLSCALAGRILRPSSQRVLFATTYFSVFPDLDTGLKRWKLFCDALNTSSDLGRHVRYLRVDGIPMNYDIIVPVFSRTENLNKLAINSGFKREPTPWAELEIQTQRLLLDDVFPRLTYLNLEGLKEIPVIAFESLPSLKRLECSDSILPLDTDIRIGAGANQRPLTNFRLHYTAYSTTSNHTSIAHLVDYFTRYQCRLYKLTLNLIYAPETSFNNLMRLFALCKASLQRLSFYCIEKFLSLPNDDVLYNSWFHGVFKLDQYPSLTNLSVEFNLEHYMDLPVQDQLIRHLALVLASGQPTLACTGLRFVSIEIDFESVSPRGPSFWSPIMEALTVISTLEKVSFTIRLWDFHWVQLGDNDESEKARIELSAYLPWKKELKQALNEVGLLAKSEIKLDMDFAEEPIVAHNGT